VTTVRLASEIGIDKVADCAKRLGVFDNMPHYLSYALGAGKPPCSETATAYAMMVNV
jgi:penicillin-binding protein 1A